MYCVTKLLETMNLTNASSRMVKLGLEVSFGFQFLLCIGCHDFSDEKVGTLAHMALPANQKYYSE